MLSVCTPAFIRLFFSKLKTYVDVVGLQRLLWLLMKCFTDLTTKCDTETVSWTVVLTNDYFWPPNFEDKGFLCEICFIITLIQFKFLFYIMYLELLSSISPHSTHTHTHTLYTHTDRHKMHITHDSSTIFLVWWVCCIIPLSCESWIVFIYIWQSMFWFFLGNK